MPANQEEYELIDPTEIIEPEDDGNTPDPVIEDDGNTPDEPGKVEQPAEEKPAAGGHIPKARFNEVISQREALKEQLAEAQRQLAEVAAIRQPAAPAAQTQAQAVQEQTTAPSLKALRAQYRDALMEGDMDKAAELDEQIDEVVLTQAEARVMQRQAVQQAQSALKVESDRAIADYPYLDTPAGADALELILLSRDRKAAAGIPIAQALRDAVNAIAPRFAPDDANPAQGLQNSATKVDNRTSNAIARGAADSIKQPPSTQAGVGNRATAGRVDVASMTDEQFASMSDAEKKRLRGDM